MATLNQIREKLLKQNEKKSEAYVGGDNASYPFWNASEGTTTTVRFLPDKAQNDFFWVERNIIRLPFSGIKGDPSTGNVTVDIPCMHMYGEQDFILNSTREWWNSDDPEIVTLARTYWKKKSWIFQGFVVNSEMKEENAPENPIRRFLINSTLFDIIKASLMDPEMEFAPCDFTNGADFRIIKTTKNGYADYKTSKFSNRTRSLTDEEMEAIETHGLFNLRDYIPKKPSEEEQHIIKEMFEASVNGEEYDPDRFGRFYRPYGVAAPSSSSSSFAIAKQDKKETSAPNDALAKLKKRAKAIEEDDAEVETSGSFDEDDNITTSSATPSVDDILERLRKNRK